MPATNDPLYFGREQTLIKHKILEKYLERFALIVGRFSDAITYVDGFSGPWNCQSEKLEDASFSIALRQLRNARRTLKEQSGHNLKIRCYFIEKDKRAYDQLKTFAKEQIDDVEIEIRHGEFEALIDDIIKFIRKGPQRNFPFIFIDPTGWTGFSMGVISPLIKLPQCEILINFMTSHVVRFIEAEPVEIGASFEKLYGDSKFRSCFEGLMNQEREDAIVFAYAERIATVGGFAYVPVTVVPHPERDATYFHLVYATRDLKGLEVFKDSERKALEVAGELRADAKRRKRERNTGQAELFAGETLPDTNHTDYLHQHYQRLAKKNVLDLLHAKLQVPYDELFSIALRYPLVTQNDLRSWISEVAEVQGLGPREKPKPRQGLLIQMRENMGQLL
jgi:three-Cys-motif partner protein